MSLTARRRRAWLVRRLRQLWAAPTTLLGLVGAAVLLLLGGRARRQGRTLEVSLHERRPSHPSRRWPFVAMALGHVILGRSRDDLVHLRTHERVHVRQCEALGPFFVPAYLLAGAWAWVCGRSAYRDNPFERAAFRVGP